MKGEVKVKVEGGEGEGGEKGGSGRGKNPFQVPASKGRRGTESSDKEIQGPWAALLPSMFGANLKLPALKVAGVKGPSAGAVKGEKEKGRYRGRGREEGKEGEEEGGQGGAGKVGRARRDSKPQVMGFVMADSDVEGGGRGGGRRRMRRRGRGRGRGRRRRTTLPLSNGWRLKRKLTSCLR